MQSIQDTSMNIPIHFNELDLYNDETLRDYQLENKKKIYDAWERSRSVMLQMPTGTGKTRLFVSIVKDLHNWGADHKRAVKVLILAHRKELIQQISYNVGLNYGLAHGLITPQDSEQKKYPVQVGSVPTLNRRLKKWVDKQFDVVIVDEAHHVKADSYQKILKEYPNAKILGVTATPYRLSGAGFRKEFDELIISWPISEFIKKKYLCEYEYYSIKRESHLQKEINRMTLDFSGDYLESDMSNVMDKDSVRASIVGTYLKYAKGKRGIVYTINKEHNKHVCEKFIEEGINAVAIDSDTNKEQRDDLVANFRLGNIDVLCNVDIFSEGFDCPDVEFIQLARPTKSLSKYLQQIGRGLRPSEGKENLIILDNVGLYNRFGFPSSRRKWQYHFNGFNNKEESDFYVMGDNEEGRESKIIEEGDEIVDLLHSSADEPNIFPINEQDIEKILQTSINAKDMKNTKNYREEFENYLGTKGLDKPTKQSYIALIENRIDSLINITPTIPENLKHRYETLFNIIDSVIVEKIISCLKLNSQFISINSNKNNKMLLALDYYLAFAKQYIMDTNSISKSMLPTSIATIDQEILKIESQIESLKQYLIELENKKEKILQENDSTYLFKRLNEFIKNKIESFSYFKGKLKFQFTSKGYFCSNVVNASIKEWEKGKNDCNTSIKVLESLKEEIPSTLKQQYNEFQTKIDSIEELKSFGEDFENFLLEYRSIKEVYYENNILNSKIYNENTYKYDEFEAELSFKSESEGDQMPILTPISTQQPTARIKLRVKFKNGPTYYNNIVKDVFIDTIQFIGAERVKELGIKINNVDLISTYLDEKYENGQTYLGDGLYIITSCDTNKKRNVLIEIFNKLHIDASLEEIQGNKVVKTYTGKDYGHTNSLKKLLEITINEYNKTICENTIKDTFIETIKYIGINSVKDLNIIWCKRPLLSNELDEKYHDAQVEIAEGLYINTIGDAARIANLLLNIAYELDIEMTAKIIQDDESIVIERSDINKAPITNGLIVEFRDGTIISDEIATNVYVETIEKIGIDKVKNLNLEANNSSLISDKKDVLNFKGKRELSNGMYLVVNSTSERKKMYLDRISSLLNLGLKVKLIENH